MAPVQILNQEASEERAENARLSIYVGAIAVGDLVKNTLGPKGMDKILVSSKDNSIQVTNDGATILKSIQLENAAAKILVGMFCTFILTSIFVPDILSNGFIYLSLPFNFLHIYACNSSTLASFFIFVHYVHSTLLTTISNFWLDILPLYIMHIPLFSININPPIL